MHIILPGGTYIIYNDNHIIRHLKEKRILNVTTVTLHVQQWADRVVVVGGVVIVGGGHTR